MKSVIVVGLGSMGRRRIRLLKKIAPELHIGGVDVQQDRRVEVESEYGVETFSSIEKAVNTLHPFAGVVCTAPLAHYDIIRELLQVPLHVFTEINLIADGYEELISLSQKNQVALFLSSTLLYRKDIRYLIQQANEGPVNYFIHTGQYLPDWHPWEDYKNFFVGDRRTNGCREIFAIDLPWILKAFGDVDKLQIMCNKASELDIDYPDNYIVSMQHKGGSKGVFYCDVISRCAGRKAEIFSEQVHLIWDGTPDSLYEYDMQTKSMRQVDTYKSQVEHLDVYQNDSIIEDAYREELVTFFKVIQGSGRAQYTMVDDMWTLALIDRIEGNL